MASDNIIELRDINKSFSNVQVLFNINLELKNEILGLVGKNGAGKSTLMKILYGVEHADSGVLKIFGESLDPTKTRRGAISEIAMIFQEFSLIPSLTVAENIFLNKYPITRFGLINKNKCIRDVEKILKTLHVTIDPNIKVEELSVSEKQIIEIAKALSDNKKILVMDEPTAALSSDQVKFLFEIIRKLKSQEISIIYISHNLREVMEISDRISILRNGRNIGTLNTDDSELKEIIDGITGVEQGKIEEQISKITSQIKVMQRGEPLLTVKNLTYKNKVQNISFDLYPGEILGIAGLAGSGRTEILECIFGVNRIQEGGVYLSGKNICPLSPEKAIRNGIILIPDERQVKGLILDHSIKDNMILPILEKVHTYNILNFQKISEISIDLLRKLKIVATNINQTVKNLSGGNQQKVVISKAISTDAKILLLDEPTIGVDVESKQEIARLVSDFVHKERKGALFVSSELEMVSEVCNRILILRYGKIVDEIKQEGSTKITEADLLSKV